MVTLKTKMSRNKPEFCVMRKIPTEPMKSTPEYKVILEHASMFIRKVKMRPSVSLEHSKAL